MKRVTVHLVINGEKCCATQVCDDLQWQDTGYRLHLIKSMTRYLILEAAKGVEPRVVVEDCDRDVLLNLQPLEPVRTDGALRIEAK